MFISSVIFPFWKIRKEISDSSEDPFYFDHFNNNQKCFNGKK